MLDMEVLRGEFWVTEYCWLPKGQQEISLSAEIPTESFVLLTESFAESL